MAATEVEREAGFTLIEVLVGMAVLALSLTAAFGLVTQAVRMIRPSRDTTLSMHAAQIELERLRMSWDVFNALGAETTVSAENNPALAALRSGTVKVFKTPFIVNQPVYSVTVEVSWLDPAGRRKTNALSSMIGEGGLAQQ